MEPRIIKALDKGQLEIFFKQAGIKRAKVIEKKRHLEVRAEKKDIALISRFLQDYSIQFSFETKNLKPWEARLKKIVFIKKWKF